MAPLGESAERAERLQMRMLSATALEEHRAALTGRCYRMLGSLKEADDAVQVTMLRESISLAGWTSFLDTARPFPRFGLPPTLPPEGQA